MDGISRRFPLAAAALTVAAMLLTLAPGGQRAGAQPAGPTSDQPRFVPGVQGPSTIGERIVGAWRLVSVYEENENHEDIAVFGADPQGQFIATDRGQFSFQIVSRDGRRFAAYRPGAKVTDAGQGLRDAVAYFGTYSIDEATGALTLHAAYCLYRSCDKTRREASVRFVGDKMEMTAVVGATPTGSANSFLTWERQK